jgi:hypothetical protein
MFVGCGCRCVRDRGESSFSLSIPPSGSLSSGQSEAPIITSDCISCRDGVSAAVYEMAWNYTSAFATSKSCCQTYTEQKTYRLYRRFLIPGQTSDPFYCEYFSEEWALHGNFNNVPCFKPRLSTSRVRMSFNLSPAVDYIGVRIAYMEYNARNSFYEVSVAGYSFPQNWDRNCLDTVTLYLNFRRWSMSRPFMPTTGFGSPCNCNFLTGEDPGLPSTITIQPVPA